MDNLQNCCIDVLRVLQQKDRDSGFPIPTIMDHYFRLIYTERASTVFKELEARDWISGDIQTSRITTNGKQALANPSTDEYFIDRLLDKYYSTGSWYLVDEILGHMQVKIEDNRKRLIVAAIKDSGLVTQDRSNLISAFKINDTGINVLSQYDKFSDYLKSKNKIKDAQLLNSMVQACKAQLDEYLYVELPQFLIDRFGYRPEKSIVTKVQAQLVASPRYMEDSKNVYGNNCRIIVNPAYSQKPVAAAEKPKPKPWSIPWLSEEVSKNMVKFFVEKGLYVLLGLLVLAFTGTAICKTKKQTPQEKLETEQTPAQPK